MKNLNIEEGGENNMNIISVKRGNLRKITEEKIMKKLVSGVALFVLACSMSFAGWTFGGYFTPEPTGNTITPITIQMDAAGNLYYGTYNGTGVVTTLNMYKVSDPLGTTSRTYLAFDELTNVANMRNFGYTSIDTASNVLYTVCEVGSAAGDRIRKYDISGATPALDLTWGGGDGEVLGSEAICGNTRVNAVKALSDGKLIVSRLVGTTQPFMVLDATGTLSLGTCSTSPISGFNPRDIEYDPVSGAVYINQGGMLMKWTGGTPANPANYYATASTGPLVNQSVASNGIYLDASTDPANPVIYLTDKHNANGGFMQCFVGANMSISAADQIGTAGVFGNGTDGELSLPCDMVIGYINGTKYAFVLDGRASTVIYTRIAYFTGNTSVPVELAGFEVE